MYVEGKIMAGGNLVDEDGNILDTPNKDTDIYTWIADKDNPKKAIYEQLPNKSEIVLLGTRLHFTGNSTRSMEHRLTEAENTFWKHYTRLGNKKN